MKASEFFSLPTEKQNEILSSVDDLVIDLGNSDEILNELLSKIINGNLRVEQAQLFISKEQLNKETIIIKVVNDA
ncbi:hypothetical protein LQU85_08565 [Actinobacillus pleuropneumoniae]|uniref:hypothetical protein n=1 Tax=Actinobacillus pleuropneumoniae TaxID=715 RepID=UPI0020202EED|nr:hypothetical protein [Actinobacillus pleuropneumoniae]MCL7725974.1 hypothetical protein [Actinobacillus pleuropneumoniae]MCL7737992.1 hypothetical protein [Actinobacillus pleuropneumoniae]